jgi:hypothetical protein
MNIFILFHEFSWRQGLVFKPMAVKYDFPISLMWLRLRARQMLHLRLRLRGLYVKKNIKLINTLFPASVRKLMPYT